MPGCFSLFYKGQQAMYFRSTILICALGAGGLVLLQHPSAGRLAGAPAVVMNPHVEPQAATDTSTDPGKNRWLIVLGSLATIAIGVAAVVDRLRLHRQPEEDFVYHIPTSVSYGDDATAEYEGDANTEDSECEGRHRD